MIDKSNFAFSSFFKWSSSPRSRFFRLLFVAIFFSCGYFSIIFQLLKISSSTSHYETDSRQANKIRRDIVDRNGHLLATNIPLLSLFANPKKIINPEVTAAKLKDIIPDLDTKKLLVDLSKDKSFVWVKRELTPEMQDKINDLGLAGLYFESENKRIYTQGRAMSHILGYVDRDNNGIAGIEKSFDKELTQNIESDPLTLSIDYRVQNIVSDELDRVIKKFSALGGAGIVADATNGEILAMVSKPDFDPHKPSKATPTELFNKSSLGAYEMGSVIKTLTFAMAFDTGVSKINDVYNIGHFVVGKFRVKDFMSKLKGWATIPQIFMHSSNIGTGMIALKVGKRVHRQYLDSLGFTKQVDIEIPERAYPIVPSIEKVTDLNLLTMSYGYGFSISPLHFVQGMIPVMNGGIKYPMTILKRENSEIEGERVLSEETSMNIIKLMRLTVDKGTGKKAAVKGYLVAGKTGTANKLDGKGYSDNNRFSSFVATAPSINPKFLVYIFLDNPRGIKETYGYATAGYTAAPTAGNIIGRICSLYGIEPYDEDDPEIQNILHVDYELDSKI